MLLMNKDAMRVSPAVDFLSYSISSPTIGNNMASRLNVYRDTIATFRVSVRRSSTSTKKYFPKTCSIPANGQCVIAHAGRKAHEESKFLKPERKAHEETKFSKPERKPQEESKFPIPGRKAHEESKFLKPERKAHEETNYSKPERKAHEETNFSKPERKAYEETNFLKPERKAHE
ncbi:unnamed protein product [Acanthosepion pharaonis]|uniref:Uncharacterized protein n=1 Tax=Acanthosepion pharaonis TaxID=158019 RepID=A0A812E1C9_ACAPH|nr:unnamed protein product [Sepia pharaonis]